MSPQVVLITGGGTGIGRAAALQFAAAGAQVAIVGRRLAPLEETARVSERILPIAADVLRDDDRARVIQGVVDRWQRIDVLVNNAGAFLPGTLDVINAEMVNSLFATNVLAPSLLTQTALPHLKSTLGSIINVSSTFGHKAGPGFAHYAASKAALEHLTRCWALELAPLKIRVNAVAPGPTETEILARSGLNADAIHEIRKSEAAQIPLGRRGVPDDVAAWIVHLADPAAWITGQIIAVDGGLSAA